ncbi:hybrid sensor histidine kinase/response regulator [Natrinema salinisoli]|uniref:hybrid sensor histidine kinase/response regulator n=1 Tax=Natrinema salinisoli TaxID=2878535 RepID=UPI001CF0A138|nr:PAS domain S-box protein [Natrinema salinisoli]
MTASGSIRFQRPTTVIYADPDTEDRRRTVDGLESAADGLTVDPVATPGELRDALADVDERACVVIEYQFPQTDALALYERLRTDDTANLPFLLYTATGDERLASDALTAGLSGYVPKGLEDSIDRLLAQVRMATDDPERAAEGEADVDQLRPTAERRALQAERDQYAALFEHSPDPTLLVRAAETDRIVDVNPEFEATFGYDRTDIASESIDDLLVPDDDEPVCITESVGLETVVTAAVERLTADGRRDFFLRGFAIEIDGEIYEYVIYTDISEQKRRERELERYRTLVDTVGDPMYILDDDGRIEMANDAMADALGTTRTDLVGTRPSNYMSAEDVQRAKETLSRILADEDRTWGTFEMEFDPLDGDAFLVENNVAPLLEDGTFTGSVGAIRDISDRTERERRIRRLHEGTRRLMAAESAEEVARVATEIAHDALSLEINGIHLYEESASRPVPEGEESVATDPSNDSSQQRGVLTPVAMTDETEALLGTIPTIEPGNSIAWDAFEAGETIVHGDVRRAGNVRNPETPIRSEAHIPLGEEGIFIVSSTTPNDFDPETITLARILAANVEAALERARREDELATRTAELERQNDRLDAFASTVSHDLRNPLTLAAGHLENLEAHVDGEGERYREEIGWALDRMDDLIENVLALARSGQRLTDTARIELDDVVDHAHRTVDPTLDLVRTDPLPTVEADEDRLLVLFENLFRNALEHVGTDVTITIEATDDGFAIADDGPGVPASKREAILKSGYSTSPDGTGFGLAIVSEVVDAHGWAITVSESDAGGLRFDISTADEHGSSVATTPVQDGQ